MICVITDVHNQMMSLFKEPKLVAVLCVQLFMAIKSNLIVNASQALVWIDHVHRLLFGYIHQEATTKRPHIWQEIKLQNNIQIRTKITIDIPV